jgi:hypothetical protein
VIESVLRPANGGISVASQTYERGVLLMRTYDPFRRKDEANLYCAMRET